MLWEFIRLRSEEEVDAYLKVASEEAVLEDLSIPYAITDKKKLAKEFMNTRNMKMFIVEKKELTIEQEIEILYNHIDPSKAPTGIILNRYKIYSQDPSNKGKLIKVPVTLTGSEYAALSDKMHDIGLDGLSMKWWITNWELMNPIAYKKKYREALSLLGIDKFRVMYAAVVGDTEALDDVTENAYDPEDIYEAPVIDELAMFIAKYSELLLKT